MKLIKYNGDVELRQGVTELRPIMSRLFGPAKGTILTSEKSSIKQISYFTNLFNSLSIGSNASVLIAKLSAELVDDIRKTSGSGASLAIFLFYYLYLACNRLKAAGMSAIDLRYLLTKLENRFITFLDSRTIPYTADIGYKLYYGLANTVTHDKELSLLLAELFMKVSDDGAIRILDGKGIGISYELTDGISFLIEHLVPVDRRSKLSFNNPYVLLSYSELKTIKYILPILIFCNKANRPLLIFAPGISQSVKKLLVQNLTLGSLTCAVMRPFLSTKYPSDSYRDLAAITNGHVVSEDVSNGDLTSDVLGSLKSGKISATNCSIVGNKPVDSCYIKSIKLAIKNTLANSLIEKVYQKKRLSNLLGKSAIIRIGDLPKMRKAETIASIDSAINTIRSVKRGGYLPGGCQIFYDFYRQTKELPPILLNAFKKPFEAIIAPTRSRHSIDYFLTTDNKTCYDYNKDRIVDSLDGGIIDSAEVLKLAVVSSISMVNSLNSSEVIVYDI